MAGQRQHLIQLVMDDRRKENSREKVGKRTIASQSYPLVRALINHGCPPDTLYEGHLVILHDMLSSWGYQERNNMVQIFRYERVVAAQKGSPQYSETDDANCSFAFTGKDVIKTSTSASPNWQKLRKIGVKDLVLFGTKHGCYVEGKIVGAAIQPMVGGTTMIQDDSGDALLVCFYNCLPDGLRGKAAEPLLQAKFPKGGNVAGRRTFYEDFWRRTAGRASG